MVFAIDPARIQLHAQRLNELADTTPQTKLFLEDHLELTFLDTNVLFAKAISGADDSRAAICTFMDDLNTALTDSATELELTAKRSIELDDAIEAELDAAYPDEKKSGGQASGAPEVSAPGARPSDPSSLLIAPSAPAEDDLAPQILSIDWLSPTALHPRAHQPAPLEPR